MQQMFDSGLQFCKHRAKWSRLKSDEMREIYKIHIHLLKKPSLKFNIDRCFDSGMIYQEKRKINLLYIWYRRIYV